MFNVQGRRQKCSVEKKKCIQYHCGMNSPKINRTIHYCHRFTEKFKTNVAHFFFVWIFHSRFCPFLSTHLPGNCVLNVRRVIVKYLILVSVKLFKKFKCDENEKRIKWIHRNFCTPLILVGEWGESECWRKKKKKKKRIRVKYRI